MTDLREPNTATKPPTNGTPAEDDPLHTLYRMSRTAGLGSGDYVAINSTAILSLLLGLASVLSLLYPLLLLLALAALVCGVLAFVQIQHSNGTQTGRSFALGGILLALSLGGIAGGKIGIGYIQERQDERRIGELVNRLSDMIVAKDYAKAYQTLFSESFKKDFTEQDFVNKWESFTLILGSVKKIGWGERAHIEPIRATNTRRAIVASTIQFEKSEEPGRQGMSFELASDGEWMIDGIEQVFAKAKEGQPRVEMPDPNLPQGPELPMPQLPQ